jgi:hypothetical protein
VHDGNDQDMVSAHLVNHSIWEPAQVTLPKIVDHSRPPLRALKDLVERSLKGCAEPGGSVRSVLVNAVPPSRRSGFAHGRGVPAKVSHPPR